jgi:endonuclease-8
MPEGDTIWRTARTLQAVLAGKRVLDFQSPLANVAAAARRLGIVGTLVDHVEARGKHLLVSFQGGAVLHTHQGMKGGWHVRRAGARAPRRFARAVITVEGAVATCHGSPVVEILSSRQLAAHPALSRLGPDPLRSDFDPRMARVRLRSRGELEVAVALMDQTAVAGIGNVYKSETLFLVGVSPFARVRDLDDDILNRLVATARDLMSRNLGPGERRTTPMTAPDPLWVYGRRGRACRMCGALIRRVVQGEQVRATYFCPVCQAPASAE